MVESRAMKVVSVNIRGYYHTQLILDLIDSEAPDVLCLQEAPEDFAHYLDERAFNHAFSQQTEKVWENNTYKEGLFIATKSPGSFTQHYYHFPPNGISQEGKDEKWLTNACSILHTTLMHDNQEFSVATTHFAWAPDGNVPNQWQQDCMVKFLEYVTTLPLHVMFGDFNIPRHHNYLYKDLLGVYKDEIPPHYQSSLDKQWHKLGDNPDKTNLFTNFMVDYCFTQPPYIAKNVELRFGVSDHAAVIAEIEKTT